MNLLYWMSFNLIAFIHIHSIHLESAHPQFHKSSRASPGKKRILGLMLPCCSDTELLTDESKRRYTSSQLAPQINRECSEWYRSIVKNKLNFHVKWLKNFNYLINKFKYYKNQIYIFSKDFPNNFFQSDAFLNC